VGDFVVGGWGNSISGRWPPPILDKKNGVCFDFVVSTSKGSNLRLSDFGGRELFLAEGDFILADGRPRSPTRRTESASILWCASGFSF
jgi:hypothetical protein